MARPTAGFRPAPEFVIMVFWLLGQPNTMIIKETDCVEVSSGAGGTA